MYLCYLSWLHHDNSLLDLYWANSLPCLLNTLGTRSLQFFWVNQLPGFSPSLSEKAMAPHSSPLAWKTPWTEEPGRLQSMGSPRVGHDWATSLSRFTFTHWRRKWQPTPVFLPGESQGQGSLVGYRPWGWEESDMTEWLTLSLSDENLGKKSCKKT